MTIFGRGPLIGGLAGLAAGLCVSAALANGGEDSFMPDRLTGQADPRFDTLDAYLAFLRQNGPMGIAWYQLREDGLYERIARRPRGTPPEVFTRQQLLDRFGYTE